MAAPCEVLACTLGTPCHHLAKRESIFFTFSPNSYKFFPRTRSKYKRKKVVIKTFNSLRINTEFLKKFVMDSLFAETMVFCYTFAE